MGGEVLAVVGASGSGKSTLARVAAGLEDPDHGTVEFFTSRGEVVERARRPRFVQLVFQESGLALDPRMTIRQSLEEPLRVQGLFRAGIVETLLDEVSLDPSLFERYPGALSGGQKQRVGLARALALQPKVLILDEPLAALDVSTALRILEVLERRRTERGLSVLWVTHNLSAVRSFADRVAVLEEGHLVEVGTVAEVFDAPNHAATRRLLSVSPPDVDLEEC